MNQLHSAAFPYRLTALAALIVSGFAPRIALAQQAPAADATVASDTVTITANGRGQSRQVELITASELGQLAPGSSPLEAIARLPSVSFQSADPFGAYEWSTRISVRGFNQNQLGFTLDDVPLGDMSYGNYNGLHISRAISTENLGRSVLSAGTGSLSTASSSNLGGTLQFYSIDPADHAGAFGSVNAGSFSDEHVFLRLESGQTGFGKAYLSLSDQQSDKWKGQGQQRSQQVNLKYVLDAGGGKLTGFANASRRREIDYQDLSLSLISQYGDTLDNTYPNFNAALAIANTVCGNGTTTYTAACDYQYYAGSGLRNDELYGVAYDKRFSEAVHAKATVYHHNDKGDGLWYTPYVPSPDGTPISIRTTEYRISRTGLVATADVSLGMHMLKFGTWLETNDFDQARRFYASPASAVPSPYDFPANPFYTQWQYHFKTTTQQVSAEDSVALSNALNINFGFKSLDVKTTGTLQAGDPTVYPSGEVDSVKHFLPQLGATYTLNDQSELFAGFASNMHAFQGAATGLTPFSTTTAGFNAIAGTIKPETSQTIEGGWRLNQRNLEAVVAGYWVDFKDRLLAIQQGSGIVGNPSVLANVGRAQLVGLEASASLKLAGGWSWYNGLSLNKSQYKDNYSSNGTTYYTAGKTIVDSPQAMLKSVLSYDSGSLFANAGLDAQGKRYYTYLNDASVGGRALVNGSVGWRFGTMGSLQNLTVQASGVNLTDRHYIATVGSNGFVASDPNGQFQTLLPGSPRAVYLSLSAKI
jgi:iron complex outermembrane receptor protein